MVRFMRQASFLLLVFYFSIFLVTAEEANSSDQSCMSAIALIEQGRVKAEFRLRPHANDHQLPKFAQGPLHFSTHLSTEWVWATHPHEGNGYYAVRKGDRGALFSGPVTRQFDLLESSQTVLRSVDLTAVGSPYFLATFVVDTSEGKSLVFRSVHLANSDTGELKLTDSPGTIVGSPKDTVENFVVTARPESSQFWVTDGSSKILLLEMGEEGDVSQVAMIDFASDELDGIDKILFLSSEEAVIRFKSKDGNSYIASVYIERVKRAIEGAEEVNAETIQGEAGAIPEEVQFEYLMQTSLDPDSIVDIPEGYRRMSAHPLNNFLAISYPDRLDVYAKSEDGVSYQKMHSVSAEELASGRDFRGADFYLDGDILQGQREGKTIQYYGNLRAMLAVISQNTEGDKSFIDWVGLGDTGH